MALTSMTFALFCGQSSYPRTDSATANRYRALAEMTANLGYEVVFVNRHPVLHANEPQLPKSLFRTVNVSGDYRESGWIKRQLVRLAAIPREIWEIRRLVKSGSITFINVYSQFAFDLALYYLIARLVHAECILHLVEYRSQFSDRSLILRLNDLVFETIALRLFTKSIAISSVIQKLILQRNPKAQVVVIPPVCRFDQIDRIPQINRVRPYFLYCASLAYEDVAWFVVEAFLQACTTNVDLVLILNGKLSDRIQEACSKHDSISLLSKLNYETLIGMYKGAHALLIPLRPNIQDTARYPQKITEYLASGRPIISCKIGEVGTHFTHGIDALLTNNYDISEYAEMMRFSLTDAAKLDIIAQQGRRLGCQLFDTTAQENNLALLLK